MSIVYRSVYFDKDGTTQEDLVFVGVDPNIWFDLHPEEMPSVGFCSFESMVYLEETLKNMLAIIDGKEPALPADYLRRNILDIQYELYGKEDGEIHRKTLVSWASFKRRIRRWICSRRA